VSLALLALAAVAIVNAPRVRSALPPKGAGGVAALGAVATLLALSPLAAFAHPLAGWLGLTAPTARMAVGAVLAVSGVATLVVAPPAPEPGWPGRRAALVPVAFPVLLTPGLGLLAVTGSLDRGAAVVLVVVAGALATVPLVGAVLPATDLGRRLASALGRLLSAATVVSGLALVANGVFDI
jgi:small neutral amino acid transporter SnatA (MarC family)